jgi:hypothetical protein
MPRISRSIVAPFVLGCSLVVLVSHQASAVGFIVNPTSEVTGVANATCDTGLVSRRGLGLQRRKQLRQ